MAARAQKYMVNGKCRVHCSLNPVNLPGESAQLAHSLYEEGANRETIRLALGELGVSVSDGAIGRHKANHLDALVADAPGATDPGKKLSDLETLDIIISKGAHQLEGSSVRISPDMLTRAIDLKYKLTQGNVFEAFLGAIGAIGDEAALESPDAQKSSDEQAQSAPDE